MNWETVIGLETHVELATKSKIFCACTTAFGGAPNTHCCPVCTGMPGALPVLNGKVVEYAVRAALALGCTVTRYSLLTSNFGWMSRCIKSPSLVKSSRPSESLSSRPTGNTRFPQSATRSAAVRRPSSSFRVVT